MEQRRAEVVEMIEIALVELRSIAQPHEIASLNELLFEAQDATAAEQIEAIAEQVNGLRAFCENRHRSDASFKKVIPPSGRRGA
jgi:hypothetical protein